MHTSKKTLIIGGAGQVATGFFYYLNSQDDKVFTSKKIIIADIVEDVETVQNNLNRHFPNLDIQYFYYDYKRDLDDFIITNEVDLIIHLAPESAQSVWVACDKIPWQMFYLDASVYVSSFNNLKYPNHNLLSNFIRFDELKDKYTNVTGYTSCGANAGTVNYLYKLGIQEYGLDGLKAIYVIEKDRVYAKIAESEDEFGISWAGTGAVQELLEEPIYFKDKIPFAVKQPRSSTLFKFHLEGEDVYGHLVVHEECFNISKLLEVETGFIYGIREDITDKLNKILSKEKEFDNYHVYSPLKEELYGNDKLGVMLVYEDKEVIYYNTMENCEVASGVTLQVSAGLYASYLNLVEFKDTIVGLSWLDDYLENAKFFNSYSKHILPIFPITKQINNFSDGLLKDRAKGEYEYKALEKLVTKSHRDYVLNETFSIDNVYWSYIENIITEESSEDIKLINTYGIHFAYDRLKNVVCGDEDEFLEAVLLDFESWVEGYKTYSVKMTIEDGEFSIYSVPLSYIEEVLIDEGEQKENIIHYILVNLSLLSGISVDDNNSFFKYIWEDYKKKEYC